MSLDTSPNAEAIGSTSIACASPVFVIGSPRSGTTILAKSLGQHSKFWVSEELQVFWDLFGGGRLHANYNRGVDPGGSWLHSKNVDRSDFFSLVGIGLNNLFSRYSGGRRWIDHTPANTLIASDLA